MSHPRDYTTSGEMAAGAALYGDTAATDTDIYRMLAAARTVLSPPMVTTVRAGEQVAHLHCHHPVEHSAWEGWWSRHGAAGWTPRTSAAHGWLRHETAGHWRGWRVEIFHLTAVDSAPGRAREATARLETATAAARLKRQCARCGEMAEAARAVAS